MEKEIHYVLTGLITKVISTGSLKTALFFTTLTHPDANLGLQTFVYFQFFLSQSN